MSIDSIEPRIRDYIARNLLFSGEGFPHPDDASLLEGIIDSLGIVELVEFVQQSFGIEIHPAGYDLFPQLRPACRPPAHGVSLQDHGPLLPWRELCAHLR